MLDLEPLLLSTQTVISLSLKLKRGLNALLPAHVGLRALAFEYSNRDFFEPQKWVLLGFWGSGFRWDFQLRASGDCFS